MLYITGTIAVFAGLYFFYKQERQIALFCLLFGVVVLFIGYAASVPATFFDPRVSAEATNLNAEAGKFDAEAEKLKAEAGEIESVTNIREEFSKRGLFAIDAFFLGIGLKVMWPIIVLLLIAIGIAFFVGRFGRRESIIQE